MLLTKMVLKNYGVYRDENVFDLETTAAKPVILIGGTNGAGKTTFFEALMLGLYGQAFFDKRTAKKEYEKFLSSKIHRYIGTRTSADFASIVIDFKFFHNGKVEQYSVDRTWKNEDGRIDETLQVRKDGQRLDELEESQWPSFIEEIIPKGIAKLFFFDGEKIVKIAEEGNEDIEIQSSFDTLLGLDIVDQLHADLRIHIMRSMKDGSREIQVQHDKHLAERDSAEGDIEHIEARMGQKKSEQNSMEQEIKSIESQISKMGGTYASKRAELQEKRAAIRVSLEKTANEIRDVLSKSSPFCLIPEQMKAIKDQIIQDQGCIKKQFERQILDSKSERVSKALATKKFWQGIKVDPSAKEAISSKILSELSPGPSADAGKPMLDLAASEYARMLDAISGLGDMGKTIKSLADEYRAYDDKLHVIDAALINSPDDDEIGPLVSKLSQMREDYGMLKGEIDHLEQQLSVKQAYVKMLNSKMRNIISEKYKNKSAGKQVDLASKVQKVLDLYIDDLKSKKLHLLQGYLLEEMQRLLHKKHFVEHVAVDRKTFAITLYRQNGDPISKDLLSKGEQQMFATAVLLALARTSGKPLPFVIDTPLARLDVEHRDNLVEKFFPYASHQVIILSTDSEIDAAYRSKLEPHLTCSYSMAYLADKGMTECKKGYFWDKEGEQVAV